GKYRIPLSKPFVEMRRKSRTFWHILGERHIGSTILRVPITFPPEKFNGRLLSAMCAPDLLGTQGTFALFSSRTVDGAMESGNRFRLTRSSGAYQGEIEGPENYLTEGKRRLKIPFTLTLNGKGLAALSIGVERHELRESEYSPWIRLTFRAPL